MGDRGQVHFEDTDVWLYTHWGATNLPEVVREALAKEMRWRDPSYLARIVFDTMIGDSQGSETGYGIDDHQHGDVYRVVHINCSEGEVTVENGAAAWHDDKEPSTETYSFKEYINLEPNISYPEQNS